MEPWSLRARWPVPEPVRIWSDQGESAQAAASCPLVFPQKRRRGARAVGADAGFGFGVGAVSGSGLRLPRTAVFMVPERTSGQSDFLIGDGIGDRGTPGRQYFWA